MTTFSTNDDYIGTTTVVGRVGLQTLKELLLDDGDLSTLTTTEQLAKVNAELDTIRANAFQDVCEKLPSFSVRQVSSLVGKNAQLKEAEIASAIFKMIKRKRTRVDDATFARVQNDYVEYFGNFGGNIVGILGEFNKGTRKLFEVDGSELKNNEVKAMYDFAGVNVFIADSKTDKYQSW